MAYATKTDLALIQTLAQGKAPELPSGEKDWPTYFQRFLEHQGMTRSWAVAESLLFDQYAVERIW